MLAHIVVGTESVVGAGATAWIICTITKLFAFALDDEKRWCHFRNFCLFAVFLVLAIAAAGAWWLLYDGGLGTILHAIGTASTTQPDGRPR